MKRLTPRLAVVLLAAAVAFAATASGAAAKTPCGEKIIDDWYGSKSGQLSRTYPLRCYRDALAIVKHRADLDVYSNASQDILFALQLAISKRKGPPGGDAAWLLSNPDTADALPSWYGGPDAKNGGHAPPSVEVVPLTPTGKGNPGPVTSILQSSSASSVPLPAIVLGAIAALLLVLGSTAYIARRRQQRRQTLRPQTEPGPPNA